METIENLYAKAYELLDAAKEMSCKPEEDVVPYEICQNSYEAIQLYFQAYLEKNNVSFTENDGPLELLAKCKGADDKFNSVHWGILKHRKESEHEWMNVERAEDYIDLAEKTRSLVL
ncbi:MAG: hypothetical protein JXQ87_00405 [Bacteroidia bacterium]